MIAPARFVQSCPNFQARSGETRRPAVFSAAARISNLSRHYFCGGGGVKISRLRPGSGFGFGLGAFFASRLPLSLFPMQASMPQLVCG